MLVPGIDLVAIDDVREALRTHGDQYLQRVFTPSEIAHAGGSETPDIVVLAQTMAAKEAVAKTLRSAGGPLPWSTIEIRSIASGALEIGLTGAAAALAERRGLDGFSVTTTTEGDVAAAIVVAGQEPR